MVEFNHTEYGSSKGILMFPDHYVAVGVTHPRAEYGNAGIATLVGSKYIVKAGTIYPANDGTAVGVVLNDVDVTNGEGNMAIVLHGFIKMAALPVVPAAAALSAMKATGLYFMPLIDYRTVNLTCTKKAIVAGAEPADFEVVVYLEDATFRDEAGTLTNWTIEGETTVKLDVAAVSLAANKKSVTFTVESTAGAVAGNLTVRPSAACIDINFQPAAATIATVSAG